MAIFDPKENAIGSYIHLWDYIPADTTLVKGDPAVKQDVFGFIIKDCESITEEMCFVYKMNQVDADKETGTGMAIISGDRLYYYPATEEVRPTKTGTYGTDFYYCGIALRDAGASETKVLMEFDGTRYDEDV